MMADKQLNREELIELVDEYRRLPNQSVRQSLGSTLRAQFSKPDILDLCEGDLHSESIVDFCLEFDRTQDYLNRQELIELVQAIQTAQETSEVEDMLRLEAFLFNCRHPAGSDLIFYPDDVFGEGVEVTAEMIVDKALSDEA